MKEKNGKLNSGQELFRHGKVKQNLIEIESSPEPNLSSIPEHQVALVEASIPRQRNSSGGSSIVESSRNSGTSYIDSEAELSHQTSSDSFISTSDEVSFASSTSTGSRSTNYLREEGMEKSKRSGRLRHEFSLETNPKLQHRTAMAVPTPPPSVNHSPVPRRRGETGGRVSDPVNFRQSKVLPAALGLYDMSSHDLAIPNIRPVATDPRPKPSSRKRDRSEEDLEYDSDSIIRSEIKVAEIKLELREKQVRHLSKNSIKKKMDAATQKDNVLTFLLDSWNSQKENSDADGSNEREDLDENEGAQKSW